MGTTPRIMNAKAAVQTVQQALELRRDMLAKLLPKHLTAERLMALVGVAMSRNPKLLECTTASLVQAFMLCAELGLEPGPRGVWLVPFRNGKTGTYEIQPVIDYRGLLDLARRSGEVSRIEAHVVHSLDRFNLKFGVQPVLEHTPALQGSRGDIVGAYAVAVLKDGAVQVEYMNRDDIENVRGRSRAKDGGPWVTDFPEMARKTVLRRLLKYLPSSVQMRRAEESEDDEDALSTGPMVDITGTAAPEEDLAEAATTTSRLKAKVKAQTQTITTTAKPGEPTPAEQAEILAQEQGDEGGVDTRDVPF